MVLGGCIVASTVGGTGGAGGQPDFGGGGEIIIPVDTPYAPSGNGGRGAGIYNAGTMQLSNCTVADNTAGDGASSAAVAQMGNGGSGGSAGGIFITGTIDL